MALVAGARLGPYEILAPLGAGGMGEVYRARDSRLGREVALKVLPPEVSQDSGRLRRFEKEAQSASALNHPNIVTVFDVGSADSTSYIAMELVDGVTLRQLLAEGALPMKKMLALGAQVAEGLAKAHAAGIVHRDLKPENVMVTKDGFAKILDFGLAKLTQPEGPSGDATQARTVSGATEPGIVVGTVSYMSPEQTLGKPLDFRSDQFSFGSMLYEMATAKRAFARASGPETMTAIIREEPEPLAAAAPATPVPLRWIVERCLAKDARERYASTEDLARDLATLRERLAEATSSREPSVAGLVAASPARRRVATVLVPLAALALGFFAARPVWRTPPSHPPTFHRLTFRRGSIGAARFSADGQTIVYSAAWETNPSEIFSTRVESVQGRPLGLPGAGLFALSSAGEMALALPGSGGRLVLARAPLGGGGARPLVEDVEDADWDAEGKNLAVVRALEGKTRVEFPAGKTVYTTEGLITHLRVSPQGNRVALIEHPKGREGPGGSVLLLEPSGQTRALTDLLPALWGLSWSASGDEVWMSEGDGSSPLALSAVTLSGRRRAVARAPVNLYLQDISRTGSALVSRGSITAETYGHLAGDPGDDPRTLTWMDRAVAQDLASDGTILFAEHGEAMRGGGGAYVRKPDGSFIGPLGEGSPMAVSPDGKWVLVTRGSSEVVLLPTGAGEPRSLPKGSVERLRTWYRWFADGRRILFNAAEPGKGRRCWVQDIDGGLPKPVTPEGKFLCMTPSPDGRFVLTRDGELFPLDEGASRQVPGLSRAERLVQWSADAKSVYVYDPDQLPAKVYRVDLSSGRRELWKQFVPSDATGVASINYLWMTPDAKSYVYSYERELSDLYLVGGLK